MFLMIATWAMAQETIISYDENTLPVLNEEFRRLRESVESVETTLEDFTGELWEDNTSSVALKTANDIDFQEKEALSFVVENRTTDPSSPVTGQIWFRTNL